MTNIKVTPVDFTGAMANIPIHIDYDVWLKVKTEGHMPPDAIFAAAKLIFTKNTRLKMSAGGFEEILRKCWDDWAWAEKELNYMAGTIPSSWEFVNVTFMIENVSRAAAQQITRTRTASFAMQSQRVTDMSDVAWCNSIQDQIDQGEERISKKVEAKNFDGAMRAGVENYSEMVARGVPLQDARGLLPMNVHCNLVAEYNLRTIVDLVQSRDNATRVQGEYFEVVQQIKRVMIELYPWVEIFFEPKNKKAIDKIQSVIASLEIQDLDYSKEAMELAKAIDLVKKG